MPFYKVISLPKPIALPSVDGAAVFGATSQAGDADPSVRASDHEAAAPTVLAFGAAKRQAVVDFERHYLAGLIAATRGNVSEAARRAQVDRMHLHRLLQAHGLRGKRAAP